MLIKIDTDSHIPLYQQIIDEIIHLVATEKLLPGDNLPSIRNLAEELNVNPATVVRAYRNLEDIGVIKTRKGKKSRIVGLPEDAKVERLVDLYNDFLVEVKKMGYTENEVIDIVSEHSLNTILAIDVGSTTTKAILFKRNGNGKMVFTGFNQAGTTVEALEEDVWIGIIDSIEGLEKKTNCKILKNNEIIIPSTAGIGVDLFLATSSAGGGLQMVTAGLVKCYTAESSKRAALGAGAIVMDVLAVDDGRTPFEKINELKELKPDIILLSGGTEGGAISGVVQIGEILASSEVKGKFGNYNVPLVYAGNSKAGEFIKKALKDRFDLSIIENIRPELGTENLLPARKEILRIFMEHVMKRAPGYNKLTDRISAPILPTPGAVFELVKKYSEYSDSNLVTFDMGGATTDVLSAYGSVVVRTVSANIGMSYSLLQSIERAGLENVMKMIPVDIEESNLLNIAANKMITPTSLPSDDIELEIEKAVAKNILDIAYEDHKKLAEIKYISDHLTPVDILKNKKRKRESQVGHTELNPLFIDMIIGSGGMLAYHERIDSLEIILDGIETKGITELFLDSAFMMPHLGVLSSVYPALALELLERECLIKLATVISCSGNGKKGKTAFTVNIGKEKYKVKVGDLLRIPAGEESIEIEINPVKRFDAGNGKGIPLKRVVKPGKFGVICDMRKRPLNPSKEDILKWKKILSGDKNG